MFTFKTSTQFIASAAAVAVLAPAAAIAASVDVTDVSLTKASTHQANVMFETDAPLARGDGGIVKGSVRFDGGSFNIRTSSHEDNRYLATVKTRRDLAAGKRYTVRIVIAGEEPVVKTLRLR